MKAQMIGFLIIMALVFVVMSTVLNVSMNASSFSTIVTAKEVKILSFLDQVEAVKTGIKYMLNFSFQQGVYELAKRGCYVEEDYNRVTKRSLWQEDYPLWRNYTDKVFLQYLNDVMSTYQHSTVEEYFYYGALHYTSKDIEKYLENLKESFEIEVKTENLEFSTRQNSNYKEYFLKFNGSINCSQEYFLIKDVFKEDLNVTYLFSTFFEMLDFARNKFLEGSEIETLIERAILSLPKECREIRLSVCEQEHNLIDFDELIKNNCPDIDKKLGELLQKEIENYYISLPNLEVKLTLDTAKFSYEYSADIVDSSEDKSCGCKKVKRVKTSESCNGKENEYCKNLGYSSGECDTQNNTIVCLDCEFYKRDELNVVYNHLIASKVFVDIFTKEFYPLYEEKEGKTNLRPITLKFSVITSNDYSWRPI